MLLRVSVPEWVEIALLGYACLVLLACGVVLVPMTALGRWLARLMSCIAALFFYGILIRVADPGAWVFWTGVALRAALGFAATMLLFELHRVAKGPVNILLLANDVVRDGGLRLAEHVGLRKRRR